MYINMNIDKSIKFLNKNIRKQAIKWPWSVQTLEA